MVGCRPCRARAVSSHAAAALPRSLTSSRRHLAGEPPRNKSNTVFDGELCRTAAEHACWVCATSLIGLRGC